MKTKTRIVPGVIAKCRVVQREYSFGPLFAQAFGIQTTECNLRTDQPECGKVLEAGENILRKAGVKRSRDRIRPDGSLTLNSTMAVIRLARSVPSTRSNLPTVLGFLFVDLMSGMVVITCQR